jgi:hypothetical protein
VRRRRARLGGAPARTVAWRGKGDVSALAGKPVRLRFAMRDAKLHAFQFSGAAGGGKQ